MNLQRIFTKFKKAVDTIQLRSKVSYSQSGEDIIVDYFFESIGISKPTYADIGANQPVKGNNTYLFYLKGSRGVCIEPDISLISTLKQKRPGDLILNLGISTSVSAEANFYFFDGIYSAWNTFSKEDADQKMKESGLAYRQTKVKLETVENIINQYQLGHINFISLDVEGWDLPILQSIDFSRIRPEMICVETITFSLHNTMQKNADIINYMLTQGYKVYADTNLNTLFCRNDIFNRS
ncbi:FkbM family methyltransferase [Lacibacter sp. MH-610]|uniref:FkbM family methyltransferase n=1 Tax=Lacibacter sp. MH-610 TaxID=3020883 RepID=UPI00389207C3